MLRPLAIFVLGAFSALSACSSSDSGTTPASQTDTGTSSTDTGSTPADTGGGGDDTGGATDTGSTGETGPAGVNGCNEADYVDGTTDATKRVVGPWNTSLGTKCIKIKKGQSVTWDGVPTSSHPLEASGGDTPSPITNASPITFDNEGTFGFHCSAHPALMKGAIKVVP